MKAEFKFKNEKFPSSRLLALLILMCFVLYFAYLEWYWLTIIYVSIIGYIFISYFKNTRVKEVIVSTDHVEFVFMRDFKTQTSRYRISDLTTARIKNPAYKFSDVYDLIVYRDSRKLFRLLGATEFPVSDINDLYRLLNKS